MNINRINFNKVNYQNFSFSSEKETSRSKNNVSEQSYFNNNHAQALKNQRLYNIAFKGGKQEEIYAIDEELNCRKFRNQKIAAQALGMEKSIAAISSCITGRRNKGNRLYFVKASEVETENENGEKILDLEKVKNAINKRKPIRAIYAIDKYGNYQKFDSQVIAAKELDLNVSLIQVGRNLRSDGIFSDSYTFVYPEEIEEVDEQGKVFVSEKKVKEHIDSIEAKMGYFYAIDKDGYYKKYKQKKEAAADLGLHSNTSNISYCLSGKTRTAGGFIFVLPEAIETTDKNGNKVVDIALVQQLIEERFSNPNAIYSIDKFGNYKKFEKSSDAIKELGFPEQTGCISQCINGNQKSTHGYTFVKATEVEIKDENGTVTVDKNKIEEITTSRFQKHPYKQNQRFK